MAIKISGSTIIDDSRNIVNAGIVTATSFSGNGSGLTGVGVGTADNINTTGIITATSFVGVLTGNATGLSGTPNITVGVLTATSINIPPVPITFSPAIGATGVSVNSNIIITFNVGVTTGTGNITLRENSASGTAFSTIGVSSSSVTISGGAVTIDPPANIGTGVTTFVVVDAGAFSGLTTTSVNALINTYSFTTANLILSSINPANGATNVGVDTNITLTLNQPPTRGTGTITLRSGSTSGSVIESFDAASSVRISISGNNYIIDPTSNLGFSTSIHTIIPSTAIVGYVGLNTTGADTHSFTTANLILSSINPANGATNVSVDTNITLTFPSAPTRGTGTVQLRAGSTSGSVIESFDAASSDRISISGNNYIIDPTSNLGFSTSIHTIIPSTAIVGYVGLNTTGADTHSFTTVALNLGDSYEGGFLICKASPLRWVVSPYSAEVSRNWYNRNDANTRAQQVSGCTGWFVPTRTQLQNPGYCCRSFWGPSPCYSSTRYWSSTEHIAHFACTVCFNTGNAGTTGKHLSFCVRAFRCVTY